MKTSKLETSRVGKPFVFSLLLILTAMNMLPVITPPVAGLHSKERLNLRASTDKSDYLPGEPVHITILLSNERTEPVTLIFSSSCLSFFAVFDVVTGVVVYDHRGKAVCLDVLVELQIRPGKTAEIGSFTWNQIDDSGDQLSAGFYLILGITKFQLCDVTCREFELIAQPQEGGARGVPLIRIAHLVIVLGSMRGIVGGWVFAAFPDPTEPLLTAIYTVPQDIHPVDRVEAADLMHIAMGGATCTFPGTCVVQTSRPDVTYQLSSSDSFILMFDLPPQNMSAVAASRLPA